MNDTDAAIAALHGVLTICRTEGLSRAELKAMVDEVCNETHKNEVDT